MVDCDERDRLVAPVSKKKTKSYSFELIFHRIKNRGGSYDVRFLGLI